MRWLANFVYLLLYSFLLPRIVYRRVVHGRPLGDWRVRVLGLVPRRTSRRRCIWIHAVSVGEVNQLSTLLEPLQIQFPNWDVVLSTTTTTGMQLANKKHPSLAKFFFPIDFSWAIRNVFRRVRPDLIVLTELEIWPNLISFAAKNNTQVCVVNGRLSQSSFRGYRRIRPLVRSAFAKLSCVAAQTNEYADRFIQLGTHPSRVHVTGSLKFDGVAAMLQVSDTRKRQLDKLKQAAAIAPSEVVWVAGSTQEPEELMVARVYQKLKCEFKSLRLVVVPRHPHRSDRIDSNLQQLGLPVLRRSCFKQSKIGDPVILVDTIGELAEWWQISTVAFVGGSFGNRGGQNMIEPAAAGAAVCFGPNTWNFTQVVKLMLENKVAEQVNSEDELTDFVANCMGDLARARRVGARARALTSAQQGATIRTIGLLAKLSNTDSQVARAA